MATTSFSLLDRLQNQQDETAWQQLNDIYAPLILGWLSRQQLERSDRDDVVQDVLLVVLRRLPQFQHNRRPGAFRTWLRAISVNCLRDHWRTRRLRPLVGGDTSFLEALNQLTDDNSDLSRQWDEEHDLIVTRKLLDSIRDDVEEPTWQAFEGVALQEKPAAEVATELRISIASVYQAKSRVLARLRQAAVGLLD
ncbi:MAG: sigma-70 family RNA polymerase sigma factor [Fuerstiella sp.]|nr:sigma-70 family RNA polymerase sigma factor [Fuerstiella sp.]MCP4854271.1 sigma-70 family RNA polymerase sigma factor [Fuerstiella sp.]